MLLPMKDILAFYSSRNRAAGAFNCYNYETMRGVIEAAEESGLPVIIAFGENYTPNMELGEVAGIAKRFAAQYKVDFALHLDHCKSIDLIKKAIEAGFTSVMYDGSSLTFAENLANTRQVTALAAQANVSVEAELGSIALGAESNEEGADEQYTNPEQARTFALESGVDALAVSIGTVHGMYKGEPHIRTDILEEIHQQVDIPLVLHGGSGTPAETIQQCINSGIRKINVNTEISSFVSSRIKAIMAEQEKIHFSALSLEARAAVKEVVMKYIALLSS